MKRQNNARFSVSTWSLHRTLGRPAAYGPGDHRPPVVVADGRRGQIALLELPARVAEFGIHTMEICHFHLPSCEPAYLHELRSALDAEGIELWSLLIDGGDITDTQHSERDLAWIETWIDVAGRLGAKNVRVIAGKAAPTPSSVEMSRSGLRRLADCARGSGVRLMTENWLGLMSGPDVVLDMLDSLGGDLGLCLDFGNWRGPTKYDDLALIFPGPSPATPNVTFPQPVRWSARTTCNVWSWRGWPASPGPIPSSTMVRTMTNGQACVWSAMSLPRIYPTAR